MAISFCVFVTQTGCLYSSHVVRPGSASVLEYSARRRTTGRRLADLLKTQRHTLCRKPVECQSERIPNIFKHYLTFLFKTFMDLIFILLLFPWPNIFDFFQNICPLNSLTFVKKHF